MRRIPKHVITKSHLKEFLMEKSKNVRKAVYQFDESMKDKFPPKTTSSEVKDELAYCKEVISAVEKDTRLANIPAVKQKLNVLKEVNEGIKVKHTKRKRGYFVQFRTE